MHTMPRQIQNALASRLFDFEVKGRTHLAYELTAKGLPVSTCRSHSGSTVAGSADSSCSITATAAGSNARGAASSAPRLD
jgi:hypothetical protein